MLAKNWTKWCRSYLEHGYHVAAALESLQRGLRSVFGADLDGFVDDLATVAVLPMTLGEWELPRTSDTFGALVLLDWLMRNGSNHALPEAMNHTAWRHGLQMWVTVIQKKRLAQTLTPSEVAIWVTVLLVVDQMNHQNYKMDPFAIIKNRVEQSLGVAATVA